MVPESGGAGAPLIQRLFADPSRFDFFQAVRLLEQAALQSADRDNPDAPTQRVGGDQPPHRETVRFSSVLSLGFPSSMIADLRPRPAKTGAETTARQVEMFVTFLGLAGPMGTLPRHYTSLLIERAQEKDFAARDFMGLFDHRLISLFYRAWEKYRFFISYEWNKLTGRPDAIDPFTQSLYALVGMGTGAMLGRMRLSDEVLLHYAGHYAHFPRCAISLQLMIADYFGIPARVEQFQGQWLALEPQERSRMPGPGLPRGLHAQMGVDMIMGDRVWDVQSKIRIGLGPLNYEDFCQFLPDGSIFRSLWEMVRQYVGPELDFDVQPVLLASEVRPSKLDDSAAVKPRLGRNMWLCSKPCDGDRHEAVFSLNEPL